MAKTATVRARIEPDVKRKAEIVLRTLGVSTSEVISMLMRHVALNKELPIKLRLPNAETRAAMQDVLERKSLDPALKFDEWADIVRKF